MCISKRYADGKTACKLASLLFEVKTASSSVKYVYKWQGKANSRKEHFVYGFVQHFRCSFLASWTETKSEKKPAKRQWRTDTRKDEPLQFKQSMFVENCNFPNFLLRLTGILLNGRKRKTQTRVQAPFLRQTQQISARPALIIQIIWYRVKARN